MYLPLTEYSALQYGTTKAHQQHPQPELALLPKVSLSIFLHDLRFLAELGVPKAGKVGESQNGLGLSSLHIDVVVAALWLSHIEEHYIRLVVNT